MNYIKLNEEYTILKISKNAKGQNEFFVNVRSLGSPPSGSYWYSIWSLKNQPHLYEKDKNNRKHWQGHTEDILNLIKEKHPELFI